MHGQTDGERGLNGSGRAGHGEAVAPVRAPSGAGSGQGGAGTAGRAKAKATTVRLAITMADAGLVQARLLRAIDRQVRLVDAGLTGAGAALDERDARILGHLAKTLGTLMEIGEGGRTSKDREPPDRDDAEDRLAERIKKWARGGE